MPNHRRRSSVVPASAFAGFRFPVEVITVAVRWYLRFGLSYRDVEELLAERGVEVDHVSVYRWVQRFTPIFAEAARPRRHAVGDRWQVDETYVKVAGVWRYLYRAIDQFGQVVDVLLSAQRDARAARRFFARAIASTQTEPAEVVTDRAPAYPGVLDELLPGALHDVERYANNMIEADHGWLKARLRPEDRRQDVADLPRPRLQPEPASGPLRARFGGARQAAAGRGLGRTRPHDLFDQPTRDLTPSPHGTTQQGPG